MKKQTIINKVIDIIQWIAIAALAGCILIACPDRTAAAAVAGINDELEQIYEQVQQELIQKEIDEKIDSVNEQIELEDRFLIKEATQEERIEKQLHPELNIDKGDMDDFRHLCAIIWAEARGESYAGQQAVGIVVTNRCQSDDWPNRVVDVIYQTGQFQPVRNGQLNKGLSAYDNGTMEQNIIDAAWYACQGNKTVNVNGNNIDFSGCMFFSRSLSNAKIVLGGHHFK